MVCYFQIYVTHCIAEQIIYHFIIIITVFSIGLVPTLCPKLREEEQSEHNRERKVRGPDHERFQSEGHLGNLKRSSLYSPLYMQLLTVQAFCRAVYTNIAVYPLQLVGS